jgi:aspartate/methionine/tyrosine aminotransferase
MPSLSPFRLERWFVEFEFVPDIRNLSASAPYSVTTQEILALEDQETTSRYLNLSLGYIENPGGEALRQAVSQLYSHQTAENIQITSGATEALSLLAWSLLEPDANIVIEEPCFETLPTIAQALGFEVRRLPLRLEEDWKIDLNRLARLIDEKTRLVYLVNPHNPTGTTLQVEEIQAIARLAERVGAQLVSDEVFRLIALDGTPIPPLVDVVENAISLGDMSKPWGLGGLRIGWIATRNKKILQRISEVRDYTSICGNVSGEFLAEIALRHSSQIMAPRLTTARTNREQLTRMVEQVNARTGEILRWQRPEASYMSFVQFPFPTEDFCRYLALEHRILLLPGFVFGPAYNNFIRFGLGGDAHTFQEGMNILLDEIPRWIKH